MQLELFDLDIYIQKDVIDLNSYRIKRGSNKETRIYERDAEVFGILGRLTDLQGCFVSSNWACQVILYTLQNSDKEEYSAGHLEIITRKFLGKHYNNWEMQRAFDGIVSWGFAELVSNVREHCYDSRRRKFSLKSLYQGATKEAQHLCSIINENPKIVLRLR
ncbi:hypothetical protein J4216_02640 [Candidatus Woesearchaeota archaeon]|nr:hypothetical protein [Candidatus Woesearchaeota archaeon]